MIQEIKVKEKTYFAQLEICEKQIIGHIIDLPAAHTQGNSVDEVLKNLVEVAELVLEENGRAN